MTQEEIEFINAVKAATPDSKDMERVEKIICDFPGNATDPVVEDKRSKKAILQLNKITDLDKFKRRVKAFIDSGIRVDFSKCQIYTRYTTIPVTTYLNAMAKNSAEIMTQEFDFSGDLVL